MSEENNEWPESVGHTNKATALFHAHMQGVAKQKVNDYTLIDDKGNKITSGTIFSSSEDDYDFENRVWTNKELLTTFHPDNVDINQFWEIATKHFPQFSVAGGPIKEDYESVDEINQATLGMAHHHLGAIMPFIRHETVGILSPILEIGPGYGGFKNVIETNTHAHWHGIDVNPLFESERLHKCDGRTIPIGMYWMPKMFHGVYSINVFQHLSVSQRDSYYQQVYDRLIDGGIFIFGLFAMNDVNRDWEQHWSTKDDDGNVYCHFFNQFTLIEEEEDIKKKLEDIGFEAEVINDNFVGERKEHYRVFKCIKKLNED